MALPALRVHLATSIKGLSEHVTSAFAASGLNTTHSLQLEILSPDAPEQAADAEILFGDPGAVMSAIDHHLPKLKWMQSTWAGVNVFMDKTKRRDFTLTRIAGVFGQLMAEYVLSQILAHERHVRELSAHQQQSVWEDGPYKTPRRLTDLTLSLLGPGDIGLVVAQRAKAMGMRTAAFKRDGAALEGVDETLASLSETLARGDVIVNVLPSTPATRGLLSGDALKGCKGAVFINVGRGDIIDEESLLTALAQGWLTKAVLDVFPVEPLPQSSKLWTHPQVIITPHISAPSLPADVAGVFMANLELHAAGEALRFAVDWEKGY